MKKLLYIAAGACLLAACTSHPPLNGPEPTAVTGDAVADGVLLVSGSRFGPDGPEIVLFEDFQNGEPHATVSLDGSYIGRWNAQGNDPLIVPGGRSGGRAMVGYDGDRQRQLRLHLPGPQREIFVSFWVRVPPGTRFPGETSGAGEFSGNSSWKFAWLMHGDRGFENDQRYDICLPTYTGRAGFQIAGNTFHADRRFMTDGWWSWNEWMRMSAWIRNPLDKEPGGVFEVVSAEGGYFRHDFGAPTDRLAHREQVFDRLNIPGWIEGGGGDDIAPLYDDIYVAIGPAAAARVELADSEHYDRATRTELLLVESWRDDAIAARVPRGVDLRDGPWHLFVTRADGSRNERGLALCPDCPEGVRAANE